MFQQILKSAGTTLDDSGIDFNEFVSYMLEHERKLALTFRDLDRNKDGKCWVYFCFEIFLF